MVTYSVRCSDQTAHDCFKTVNVDIGVPDLTPEQLARIFDGGRPAVATPAQGHAVTVADTTHYVKVELDASVCTACLKDRSTEIL